MLAAILLLLTAVAAPAEEQRRVMASTSIADASEGEMINISLAVSAIDGILVRASDKFSFNETVGPRTARYGYAEAVNGAGIMQSGGGADIVALTLYLALLSCPGVQFTEISNYGDDFVRDYVSDGEVAIATDYDTGKDFAFVNNGGDMVISLWTDGNLLNCAVYQSAVMETRSQDFVCINSACFPVDGGAKVMNNVLKAAESINGFRMESGDEFSFNTLVGPRTETYGYLTAVNGRGVKVVGGGVAQVASVIWLAVKDMPDMSIIEKSTYGQRYTQNYVENSADAIATDYNAGLDFSFKYTGADPVNVNVYVLDGTLYCEICAADAMENLFEISW